MFDPLVQRAEIDTFCDKSTALIECLLPMLPPGADQNQNDDEQEDEEELKVHHDEVLSDGSNNVDSATIIRANTILALQQ